MQTSDLKNVLFSAIETADGRLLSMLYAVIKTYQITENPPAAPATAVQATTKSEPVAKQTEQRMYKDDRPRKVVRVYRKPQQEKVEPKTTTRVVATEKTTPERRVIRLALSDRDETQTARVRRSSDTVSGRSNNGGFITDLMTKTVSKNGLPA